MTVYHREGSLILARGDVRLLTVPLASPPSQVVLDGTAYVRGIAVFQAGSVPQDDPLRIGSIGVGWWMRRGVRR